MLVEPPDGASQRRRGPFADHVPGPARSLTFAYLNTSKRSLTLDASVAYLDQVWTLIEQEGRAFGSTAPPA